MLLSVREFLTFDGYQFHLFGYPGIRSLTIINAHSPFPSLLFNKNRIGKPVRVEYLSDESGYQEFGNLFAYCPTSLVVEATQALLGGLRAWDEAQCVLGDLSRYARHVRGLPYEQGRI